MTTCCGERFLGAGLKTGETLHLSGTPGNAMGAYLDGGEITVQGNVQDAVGDTMNHGTIIVHGSAGDALGYAMRGGEIYVRGSAGYRAGIHMKEYESQKPVLVIGGGAGSFLGEYMAGGLIVVLSMDCADSPAGNFTGTGMHGGKIFIRAQQPLEHLPAQVSQHAATPEDLQEIAAYVTQFAQHFSFDANELLQSQFYVLCPNATNPYHQLYVAN
ncbi:MAG: glutamate synthase [Oscillospiraceae bacterium]|nr:glutamate synthase [Oscillospiraceae bacterium]